MVHEPKGYAVWQLECDAAECAAHKLWKAIQVNLFMFSSTILVARDSRSKDGWTVSQLVRGLCMACFRADPVLLYLRLRIEAPHEAGHQSNHRALDDARHPASVEPQPSAVPNYPECTLQNESSCKVQPGTGHANAVDASPVHLRALSCAVGSPMMRFEQL
jgi:hypothetical protein